MRIVAILAVPALLAGCVSAPPPKPVAEMTPQERCALAVELMNSPRTSTVAGLAILERARNDGCLGSPR